MHDDEIIYNQLTNTQSLFTPPDNIEERNIKRKRKFKRNLYLANETQRRIMAERLTRNALRNTFDKVEKTKYFKALKKYAKPKQLYYYPYYTFSRTENFIRNLVDRLIFYKQSMSGSDEDDRRLAQDISYRIEKFWRGDAYRRNRKYTQEKRTLWKIYIFLQKVFKFIIGVITKFFKRYLWT